MRIFRRKTDELPPREGENGSMAAETEGMGRFAEFDGGRQTRQAAVFGANAPEVQGKLQPIGEQQILDAMMTLEKYRAGKANFNRRLIENEQWWKLRHWDYIKEQPTNTLQTKSAWLVNVLLSKHADAMDAMPEGNFLPRAADDEQEAKKLSAIVPVILDQNRFERVWADNWWKKLKYGTGVYGVFWDKNRLNGLGDIAVTAIDPLNLYWEPGVTDLQQSRNLFYVTLVDREILTEQYPELADKLTCDASGAAKYRYDDNVDTTDKCAVVDWYYKRRNDAGKEVLHYCKFAGGNLLFASENEAEYAKRGYYDHAKYPFVADVMFPEEGTPGGYGYIDLCKDPQRQIDLMNTAIVANCIAVAQPRYLVRADGNINEQELMDYTRQIVHCSGNLDEAAVRPIQAAMLNSNYLSILAQKVDEMKETSGNRDVNNGGAASGVTAASAIAAMQEQSGKLSRDQIRQSYAAYKDVCYLVVELIRQFYDAPREFRITGQTGVEFTMFDNQGLQLQPQQAPFLEGQALMRSPVFDIDVQPQKASAYSKMSQNELALQLLQYGFFNPAMAQQAMACLEMMDFKDKDKIKTQIGQNYVQYINQQMAMQQAAMMQRQTAPAPGARENTREKDENGAQRVPDGGGTVVEKARAQAQAATQPNG